MLVDLSEREIEVLTEALDSHCYWQLSEHNRRNDGYVYPPYTEEEAEAMALEERLSVLLRKGVTR